jgi:hypothetical protein
MIEKPTEQQIASRYLAALDCVNMINAGKPESASDEEWADCVDRNKKHIKFILAQTWWTDQNLEPLRQAIQS